jgi:coenzyme F420 biosynthesis associated uncharacterized protein
VDVIDWSAAQRIGERIAGTPPEGGIHAEAIEPLARDFASRVSAYSGLGPAARLPPLEVVDRGAWIEANLRTMRPMLAPLTARMGKEKSPFAGPMRSASGLLLGAQVGALTGLLSQRVLGQYDLALLDSSVEPRLLLLGPNLAQAARNLGLDRDELVLWVTIHEITHAVQFTGAPWLRGHLGGILQQLIEGLQVSVSAKPSMNLKLPKLPDVSELREVVDRARSGQLLRLTLGEDRWSLVEQMQAAMSLIEGHAEHTMDVIGAETLPSLPRLRAAMNRRRSERGLPWRVLERLLGLELKMRQYEQGRRFCDAIVADSGPEGLARAWSGPSALPTPGELEHPHRWIARMQVQDSDWPTPGDGRTHVPPVTS